MKLSVYYFTSKLPTLLNLKIYSSCVLEGRCTHQLLFNVLIIIFKMSCIYSVIYTFMGYKSTVVFLPREYRKTRRARPILLLSFFPRPIPLLPRNTWTSPLKLPSLPSNRTSSSFPQTPSILFLTRYRLKMTQLFILFYFIIYF